MTEPTAPRRARSMAEFGAKVGAVFTAPETGEPYRPRPSDVIIAPFAKCGTTWLQQTFHTLRTRGDMDFDDISRVVPWIETSRRVGVDLNAEQKAPPRGFKSHQPWDEIPKGARYIVSLRDPRDALVSSYKFMEGWFLEPGAVTADEFARGNFLSPERRYWHHLSSWWDQRDNEDVLLLAYEHMLADPERTVRRVAAFCGISLDDELLALTLKHSSLAFMLAHKDRFDDRLLRDLSERIGGLPPGSDSAKVREGKVGGHRAVLGDAVLAELDEIWRQEVTSRYGFASYQDLIDTLDSQHRPSTANTP
ncbi:MAG: sulfotransferase domain-containing protein [Pseudomonadales bacterium]